MKKEIAVVSMILALLFVPLSNAAFAGGEMKEVCRKEMKNGKEVEVCKKIRVHKKLEGTAVPEKAPKK